MHDFTVDEDSLLPVLTLEGVTVVDITDVTLEEESLVLVLTLESITVVGIITLDEESSLSPVYTVGLKLHMQDHNGRYTWCHSGT